MIQDSACPAGIPKDAPTPFLLLDRIVDFTPARISCLRRFDKTGLWQAIEAGAQAACLHQRKLAEFSKHAFLLSVERFPAGPMQIDGLWRIDARLEGQAGTSAMYTCDLTGPYPNDKAAAPSAEDENPDIWPHKQRRVIRTVGLFRGELTVGSVPYSAEFRADVLAERYRSIWTWLTR